MARFTKKFCIAGLGVLVLCLSACDDKKEPMKPAPPKVVSKAIELPKKPAKKVPESKPKKTAAKAAVSAPGKPGTGMSATSAGAAPQTAASPSPGAPKNETVKKPVAAPIETDGITGKSKAYARKGRLDPFLPLLSEKKEPEPVATPVKATPKRMLTPLEKMDLSQIKLVAVIEMAGRSIAMVEESSGKGYEVNIGTYMGRNGGRVSAITANGIVIKEIVQDYKGNRRERFQEIKFNKNEGN